MAGMMVIIEVYAQSAELILRGLLDCKKGGLSRKHIPSKSMDRANNAILSCQSLKITEA
jgi:hypothetical protein